MNEDTQKATEGSESAVERFVMLPCPFCGGSNIDASFSRGYDAGDTAKPMIAAGCMDCSCTGPDVVLPNNKIGYKESIAAWNNRAT